MKSRAQERSATVRPSSARKQQAILAAARHCFAAGYERTTIDEVAQAAGVSKQTVYTWFGSKEELFVDVVTRVTSEAFDGLTLAAADAPPVTTGDDLARWLREVAGRLHAAVLAPEVVRLRRLVIAEADRFPQLARTFWELGPARAVATLAERLATLRQQGLLAEVDPAVAASTFNWLVLGEPLNRLMMLGDDGVPDRAELGRHAAEAVRVFLAAHAPPARR